MVSNVYLMTIAVIMVSASIGNYYYYQTFHQPFDVFLFALFEDDTKSVLLNIWDDYPILPLILITIIASSIPLFSFIKLKKKTIKPCSNAAFISCLLISILIFGLLGRGSMGAFPLRRANAQVSESATINHLTSNAIMLLNWAWKDKKNDVVLEQYSEEEITETLQLLGINSVYEKTKRNEYLEKNPPHVVLTLMESFGSNMLAFDEPKENDMLGSLRQHFQNDFIFTRFLPHGNGTAPSLAALFFHSPIQNISHSSLSNIKLETPFSTYKNAGYKTIFISPGNLMWRNLVNYLPTQQVDQIFDQNTLLKEYPNSAQYMTDWGLPDEYAFHYAEKLLKDSSEPLFIGILTVTNHPPYRYPATYSAKPVSIRTGYADHAEEGKIDHLNLLTTFQYAANALGNFISRIKSSRLAEHTIIAATGDHQMRRIKAFHPQEKFLDRAVPFYLYIPKEIQSNLDIIYDPLTVGSHKDIMPTLYESSLSDTSYLALAGRNMLRNDNNAVKQFGYNELMWIEEDGLYSLQGNITPYSWDENPKKLTVYKSGSVQEPGNIGPRYKGYEKLLRWNISRNKAAN